MLIGPDGFLTNSTAPRSSARNVISFPRSEPAALSMTTGRAIPRIIVLQHLKPVQSRHSDVERDDIRVECPNRLDRFDAVAGGSHHVVLAASTRPSPRSACA